MRGYHDPSLSPRWYVPAVPADPCSVCVARGESRAVSESNPHACSVTLTRPAFAFSIAEPESVCDAYACAFTRALRDA